MPPDTTPEQTIAGVTPEGVVTLSVPPVIFVKSPVVNVAVTPVVVVPVREVNVPLVKLAVTPVVVVPVKETKEPVVALTTVPVIVVPLRVPVICTPEVNWLEPRTLKLPETVVFVKARLVAAKVSKTPVVALIVTPV